MCLAFSWPTSSTSCIGLEPDLVLSITESQVCTDGLGIAGAGRAMGGSPSPACQLLLREADPQATLAFTSPVQPSSPGLCGEVVV
jgi:hypothetical protein